MDSHQFHPWSRWKLPDPYVINSSPSLSSCFVGSFSFHSLLRCVWRCHAQMSMLNHTRFVRSQGNILWARLERLNNSNFVFIYIEFPILNFFSILQPSSLHLQQLVKVLIKLCYYIMGQLFHGTEIQTEIE